MQQELTALTVTQLNREIRLWLEGKFGEVSVLGELSNLSKPNSGHFYFSLKDATAQLKCVYFRNYHAFNTCDLKEGQQVIAKGKLSLYEARGDYQLIVHQLTPAGLGELYRQFEQLKIKLQSLGLFEEYRKKPIPKFPLIIGIITSATGAALQDILSTLSRRFPVASVKIYSSEVQGKEAPQQLINALNLANQEGLAEVIILARGGGSIEDLWAFNNEQLALAICESSIPVVSGIGHETDFTIADFVADLRAATPTAAAEAVTPNQFEILNQFKLYERRLLSGINRFLQQKKFSLFQQIKALISPELLINKYWQSIDYLEQRLQYFMEKSIQAKQHQLQLSYTKINARKPETILQQSQINLQHLQQKLHHHMQAKLQNLNHQFKQQLATLHAISPLATLDRGYAIATSKNSILFCSKQVNPGDAVKVRLAQGSINCEVINQEE